MINQSNYMKEATVLLEDVGLSIDEFNKIRVLSTNDLTDIEKSLMKKIRDEIPAPTNTTVLQKVIPHADILNYLDGTYKQVGGYVTKAQDVTQLNNIDEIFESLRLDYNGTQFNPLTDESFGIIRFKTPEASKVEIPYGTSMGGTIADGPPFTGNGFTAARNGNIIPEYKCSQYLDVYDGAELYTVSKDGNEVFTGIFDGNLGQFVKVE